MQNAIIPSTDEFSTMMQMADVMVRGGFLPQSIKTPQAAISIIMLGRELNIPPWQAINGINVIGGKPTVSPQLMMALIERSGLLEDIKVTDNGNECSVTMKRKGRSPHTETFSMADAERMKTKEDGKVVSLAEKFNWRSMPKVMRKWRAVSACARFVFPDVLMGIYTTEEIDPDQAIDAETGEVVSVTTPPQPEAPKLAIVEKLPTPAEPQTNGNTALKEFPEPAKTHWSRVPGEWRDFCGKIQDRFGQDANTLTLIDWLHYDEPKDAYLAVRKLAQEQLWPLIARKATYTANPNGGGMIEFDTDLKTRWYEGRGKLASAVGQLDIMEWENGEHTLAQPVRVAWEQKDGYKLATAFHPL